MLTPASFHALPLPIVQLSLAAVLKCGQSFRWFIYPLNSECHPTHEYRLCLHDRVVCLRQTTDTLFYRAIYPDPRPDATQLHLKDAETLLWVNDYFQLDVDLVKLYNEWASRDHIFAKVQSRFQGIRILRQDPWENLVSFICSSNNNISRITKMVQALCKHYSPALLPASDPVESTTTHIYHSFPPPSALVGADVPGTLRSLGFGYRADFIHKTAKMLVKAHTNHANHDFREASEKWLLGLREMETEQARQELLKFVGVGRKVADCILLMSLDKKEVIPVDTHVYQIATKYYGFKDGGKSPKKIKKDAMTSKIYDQINAKLFSVWGDYAGWAHSVLFTADLKTFSPYGLSMPVTSDSNSPATAQSPVDTPAKPNGDLTLKKALPTPPLTPCPSPLKRGANENPQDSLCDGRFSLADRVKRRRRAGLAK